MRRGPLLLLLLIVLMTLRGLIGPAMAAGMALPQAVTAATQHSEADHAGHGEDHAAGMPFHLHADAAAQPSSSESNAAPDCASGASPHAACADCEICHTTLLLQATAAAVPPGQPADRMRAPAARFASAAAALAIKPPIS